MRSREREREAGREAGKEGEGASFQIIIAISGYDLIMSRRVAKLALPLLRNCLVTNWRGQREDC